MKYLAKLTMLIALATVIVGCQELEDLTSETIPFTFIINESINVEEGQFPDDPSLVNVAGQHNVYNSFDLPGELGTDAINAIDINSIEFEIRDFSGNVDAEVVVEMELSAIPDITTYKSARLNAAESAALGTQNPLNRTSGGGIGNGIVEQGGRVFYDMDVACTHNPADFKLRIVVKGSVTYALPLVD